jgi:hypothetical protein
LARIENSNLDTTPVFLQGSYISEQVIASNNIAMRKMQFCFTPGVDLYIKDCAEDIGLTGEDYACSRVDMSPDIWVRLNDDGLINQFNEPNAFYYNTLGNLVRHVYVRVRNRGCAANTDGNIALYCSRTAAANTWPQNWDGTNEHGYRIGIQPLGTIAAGEYTIYHFVWTLEMTDNHQCLLARVENCTGDPTIDYGNEHIDDHVRKNNNISMYNCHFTVEAIPNTSFNTCGGYIYLGNFTNNFVTRDLILRDPDKNAKTLVEQCNITLTFDLAGWLFMNTLGGLNSNDFEIVGDKKVRILSSNILIENIIYPPNFHFPVLVEFDFIGSKSTKDTQFEYDIVDVFVDDSTQNRTYAGIHYYLERPNTYFEAVTDKVVIYNGSTATLSAEPQNGDFNYNWYDANNNLVGTGTDVLITPPSGTSYYRLEVALANRCFRDFATVMVHANTHMITVINPNPASNYLDVEYYCPPKGTTPSIKVTNALGINQNLPYTATSSTSGTFDTSKLAPGIYSVVLYSGLLTVYDIKVFVKM